VHRRRNTENQVHTRVALQVSAMAVYKKANNDQRSFGNFRGKTTTAWF
jgi:hypothetical protein